MKQQRLSQGEGVVVTDDMMTQIKSRRSRREFLDKAVSEDVINRIIEAGRYAPSALNKQPWKFIVITNRDTIRKLSLVVKRKASIITRLLPLLRIVRPILRDPQVAGAIKKTISGDADNVFYDAPLLIFVVTEGRSRQYSQTDCALASQNMMLYANSVGVSSCFIGRADLLSASRYAKSLIGLPRRHYIQAAIIFGYSPSSKEGVVIPERRRDNILNWIR